MGLNLSIFGVQKKPHFFSLKGRKKLLYFKEKRGRKIPALLKLKNYYL